MYFGLPILIKENCGCGIGIEIETKTINHNNMGFWSIITILAGVLASIVVVLSAVNSNLAKLMLKVFNVDFEAVKEIRDARKKHNFSRLDEFPSVTALWIWVADDYNIKYTPDEYTDYSLTTTILFAVLAIFGLSIVAFLIASFIFLIWPLLVIILIVGLCVWVIRFKIKKDKESKGDESPL